MSIKNERIREEIVEYIKAHGYPPSMQEIGMLVGFKSKNTTWNRIQQMLESGMLETDDPGSARAIRVPGYEFVKVEEDKQ